MITAVTVVALACKPRGRGSECFTPSFFVPPGCPSTTQVAARSSDPEWSRFPGTVPVYDCCHSSVLAYSSRVLSQLRTLCAPLRARTPRGPSTVQPRADPPETSLRPHGTFQKAQGSCPSVTGPATLQTPCPLAVWSRWQTPYLLESSRLPWRILRLLF